VSVPAATARIGFRNDYSEGAHPRLLAALAAASAEQNGGYGLDRHSARAAQLIRRECACAHAEVHLLVGGTQANLTAIGAFLRPHQAVIAAACGHIATHETGAIEATGHKVLTVDAADGRLSPERIAPLLAEHGNEHMVQPRLLYVSNTTELGTVYRKRELQALRAFCDAHGLWLFLDGARIGSALTAEGNDLSLADIAALTDAFYIGGTKNGALLVQTRRSRAGRQGAIRERRRRGRNERGEVGGGGAAKRRRRNDVEVQPPPPARMRNGGAGAGAVRVLTMS
jgi:threonine aldolase